MCLFTYDLWLKWGFYLLGKVIGKALVLNEIINYVQSLQRQVEVRDFWISESIIFGLSYVMPV